MDIVKNILVFKTSISSNTQVKELQPVLNKFIVYNDIWNFDLEDCDNILRIETQNLKAEMICKLLNRHGFYCEELH